MTGRPANRGRTPGKTHAPDTAAYMDHSTESAIWPSQRSRRMSSATFNAGPRAEKIRECLDRHYKPQGDDREHGSHQLKHPCMICLRSPNR